MTDPALTQAALTSFLSELEGTNGDDDLLDLCRKRVLHGLPHVFDGREDDFYEFRKRIADQFDIDFREVFITGSAKLGFSPKKRTIFSLDSDVDVAMVSPSLFDRFIEEARMYQMELRRARRAVSSGELDMYHIFLEYTAVGWIRPDKLPVSFKVGELKNDWFGFFASISNGQSEVGNYKVSAGIFRSYRHLELYVLSGLTDLRTSLQASSIT